MVIIVIVPAMVVAVDQVVKALVSQYLAHGRTIHIIEGILALRLGFNPGLAFGLLGGLNESWRWVVSLISIAALVVLARVAYRIVPSGTWVARLGIGLVFGGAVGNLIDRARLGGVVDFIDVYWRAYHWPAFNIADSAITIGVLLVAATLQRAPHDSAWAR